MRRADGPIWERLGWPGSARYLSLARAAFAAYMLSLYATPMFDFMVELAPPARMDTWSLLPRWLELAVADGWVIPLHRLAIVANVAMAIGLATRASTAASLGTYLLLYNFYYRATKSHVEWPYIGFFYLVFLLSACADAWSVDSWFAKKRGRVRQRNPQAYRWPIEVGIFWIAVTYTAAGLAKIMPLRAGWEWLHGGMVQMLFTTLYYDSPIYWLLGRPAFDYSLSWPFALGSAGAVLVELSAVTMLFTRRYNALILLAVVGFHGGVYAATGVIAFVFSGMLCGVFLVPPEWFPDWPGQADRIDSAE